MMLGFYQKIKINERATAINGCSFYDFIIDKFNILCYDSFILIERRMVCTFTFLIVTFTTLKQK